MGPRGSVNGPLIIAISVGLAIVAFVVLVWIIRWSKRKPKLPPPPRRATAYWANPPPPDDDESKMAYDRPRPYGPGEATDSSQVSLWRGPDGEYYTTTPPTTGELRMDDAGSWVDVRRYAPSSGMPSPILSQELALHPAAPNHRFTSTSNSSSSSGLFVHGAGARDPSTRSSFGPAGVTEVGELGPGRTPFPPSSSSEEDRPSTANTDLPGSQSHSTTTRPISSISRPSRNSIATTSQLHPHHQTRPAQATVDRRQSRHSLYSTPSHALDSQRRASLVRGGPPHKSNMLIVLPEPLAPTAHRFPSSSTSSSSTDVAGSFSRSQSNRRSRADLWMETNNRNSSYGLPAEQPPSTTHPRRRSHGSEKSMEIPSTFVHMEPPPPLPTSTLVSRAGTPVSTSVSPAPVSNEGSPSLETQAINDKLAHAPTPIPSDQPPQHARGS